MNLKYFIITNTKQLIAALVAKYTVEKYSSNLDRFSVVVVNSDDLTELKKLNGRSFLRGGKLTKWVEQDSQSFTLARFAPPQLMNYTGKSIAVDADVFSVNTDVIELFNRPMNGNAILAKPHKEGSWATSVMVMENEKLRHWNLNEIVEKLIEQKIDYMDVMWFRAGMYLIDGTSIGILDECWNSFDGLNDGTKLLHNTSRATQPWKTGLPRDFQVHKMKPLIGFISRELIYSLIGCGNNHYRKHPDPKQEMFFFTHLKGAIESGLIDNALLSEHIQRKFVRPDIVAMLEMV